MTKLLSDEQLDELSREMVKGDKSVNWLAAKIEAAVLEAQVLQEPVYQLCKADSISLSSAWIDVSKEQYEDAALYPEYGRRMLYAAPVVQPDIETKYNELLMCVGNKYPGESRHETALRYLRAWEKSDGAAAEGKK